MTGTIRFAHDPGLDLTKKIFRRQLIRKGEVVKRN